MTTYLGIDPGSHRLGWAVITGSTQHPVLIKSGCLDLPPHSTSSSYLPAIYQELQSIITSYHPTVAGLEKLFAQHNQKTVISVAEARGVIQLALSQAMITVTEFSPNTIKATVAGSGSASKSEVTRMVGLLLKLDSSRLLDDETDAIAIALTAQLLCKHT